MDNVYLLKGARGRRLDKKEREGLFSKIDPEGVSSICGRWFSIRRPRSLLGDFAAGRPSPRSPARRRHGRGSPELSFSRFRALGIERSSPSGGGAYPELTHACGLAQERAWRARHGSVWTYARRDSVRVERRLGLEIGNLEAKRRVRRSPEAL